MSKEGKEEEEEEEEERGTDMSVGVHIISATLRGGSKLYEGGTYYLDRMYSRGYILYNIIWTGGYILYI